MAIIWYDESMPYCELEPLAVVWWEQRKGIATAVIHEAANRIMDKFPNCKGMLGGNQTFYKSIGFKQQCKSIAYNWEKESLDKQYSKEI